MHRDSVISLHLLGHPVFLIAVGLLALNDRVLKARMPGLVTGKLSDFAGVFALAVLIAVVVRSRPVGVAATAIGFVALKAIPGAAVLAAPILGGVTRTDPSDLVALVVLVPAWWWLGRGAEDRSADVRTLLGMFGAGAGVLVMTATSCQVPAQVVHLARLADGSVLAETDGDPQLGRVWAQSHDGRTWRRAAKPVEMPGPDRTSACLTDGLCFRVSSRRGVEQRGAGSRWVTSFRFSDEQNLRRDWRVAQCFGSVGFYRSVAIAGTGSGEHVVVTAGSDGVLWRSATGHWQRREVLGVKPARLDGATETSSWLAGSAVGILLLVAAGLIVGRLVGGRWHRGLTLALVCSPPLLSLVGFFAFFGVDYTVVGPLLLGSVVVVVTLALAVDWYLPDRTRRRRRGMVMAAPLGSPVPAVEGVRPAWLLDPSRSDRLRWWDGTEWSGWIAPKR